MSETVITVMNQDVDRLVLESVQECNRISNYELPPSSHAIRYQPASAWVDIDAGQLPIGTTVSVAHQGSEQNC
ncbi:MAG TPA: hypothetical protein VNU19_05090 [Candidatus Acidoferrum sp.]|nr:hypothetical protein [Candidatus Acidoferrum sp.]